MKKAALTSTMLAPRGIKPKNRVFEVDFMRGFDIVLMIAVHFLSAFEVITGSKYGMFGIVVPGENVAEWVSHAYTFCHNTFLAITQQAGVAWFGQTVRTHLFTLEVIFAGLFVFLSGISCSFARNNFARGVQLLGVATAMTILLYSADCIMGTGVEIYMGILHAMAIAIIVYSIFNHFFPKWWQTYAAALVLSVFMLMTVWFSRDYVTSRTGGYSQYNTHFEVSITGSLMNGNLKISFGPIENYFKMFIGLAYGGDDSFSPLMLTTVLFYGAVVGKTLYASKKSVFKTNFPKGWAKPILFLGRHTLVIYIFHQVFFYIIIAIVLLLFGGYVISF